MEQSSVTNRASSLSEDRSHFLFLVLTWFGKLTFLKLVRFASCLDAMLQASRNIDSEFYCAKQSLIRRLLNCFSDPYINISINFSAARASSYWISYGGWNICSHKAGLFLNTSSCLKKFFFFFLLCLFCFFSYSLVYSFIVMYMFQSNIDHLIARKIAFSLEFAKW